MLQNSSNFLFGDDFDRADRRIVDGRSEVDLDFALGRGFDMLERFDQRSGAGFPGNIKSSEKHRSVTRDIEDPAAHTPNAAILNASAPAWACAKLTPHTRPTAKSPAIV